MAKLYKKRGNPPISLIWISGVCVGMVLGLVNDSILVNVLVVAFSIVLFIIYVYKEICWLNSVEKELVRLEAEVRRKCNIE